MRTTTMILSSPLLALLAACGSGGGGGANDRSFTPNVSIPFDPLAFAGTVVDNPLLPLTPGTTYVYEGDTEDGFEHIEVEVTTDTKVILGVTCIVVHDVAWIDGEIVEDTVDWIAQDVAGNVWYFGEFSQTIEGGVVVGTDGSWEAGVAGAVPGILMLAAPAVGDVYRQEFAAGVAEDMAEVMDLDVSEATPHGMFQGCLQTEDFTPLEPDVLENKFYAPGVGLILEIDEAGNRIELVDVN